LADAMNSFTGLAWPEFMRQDPVSNIFWHRLYPDFAAFQFAMIEENETVLAVGNSVPLFWDQPFEELPDTGWDWEMETSFVQHDAGTPPNTLAAVQIVIDPKLRGAGLSRRMVIAMRDIAAAHRFRALIAPVRPNQKHQYPLAPMARYVHWRRPDGSLFDAWLRVHESLGARLIKVCHHAMRIPGTVEQWEKWTQMSFPEGGEYIVPFALSPVTVDREANQGLYTEPNVWMVHQIG
jgi:hypothetical protein